MAEIDTVLGQEGTLRKFTITTDTFGKTSSSTYKDYGITFSIQPISQKDRGLIEAGITIFGEMKGYFKDKYDDGSGGYVKVEEGDHIIHNSVIYLVKTIVGEYQFGDKIIYIKGILRRHSG